MGDAEEPAGDEGDVLKVWFPRLEAAVLSAGDFSLRVCDSQRASWLPQHDSCVSSMYLKPDGFVIHEAYLDDVSQPRKPAHKRLFPFLRSVIEGKTKFAWGNMAMGEAIQYAKALSGLTGVKTRLLHVSYPLLLYNASVVTNK
jgi:hypothetical protein